MQPTFWSRLRQLALALLNATLLLAVLLVFAAWLLLGRVQHFAIDTATAIAPDLRARLESQITETQTALTKLRDLDDALKTRITTADAATAAQLQALRGDVQALTAKLTELQFQAAALSQTAPTALRAGLRQTLRDAADLLK
jgi:hypothetical protein